MATRFGFLKLLLAALLAAPLAEAAADTIYSVTVVAPNGSSAKGINGHGEVVGSFVSRGRQHAFLYTRNKVIDLGTLGGAYSLARGINDAGMVVGDSTNKSGHSRAFLFSKGKMTDLGTLGGQASIALTINNAGVIAGYAETAGGGKWLYAFRYQNGRMQNLGTLPGGMGSGAFKINNKGVMVGYSYEGPITHPEYPTYPVIFNGNIVKIPADEGEANGINDKGQVVGGINNGTGLPHGRLAFIYESGKLKYIGALDSTLNDSTANAINNLGQVVGSSAVQLNETHYGYRPFLYTATGTLRNLNDLIDRGTGWEIMEAVDINDRQQIAGTACKAGECFAVRLDLISRH